MLSSLKTVMLTEFGGWSWFQTYNDLKFTAVCTQNVIVIHKQ